jgi:hypothetical protein
MFLTDIPFKGCQGRSNRSLIVHVVSYFAVSITPHATVMRCQWPHMHRMRCYWPLMHHVCGVNYPECTMHGVSMTQHAHVHVVSMAPHASCMQCQWHRMHRSCGVIDTKCIFKFLHSMLLCIRCQRHRMHLKTIRISLLIRIYIQKGFSPLIRGPRWMLKWKKRGLKISWHCPFNEVTFAVV